MFVSIGPLGGPAPDRPRHHLTAKHFQRHACFTRDHLDERDFAEELRPDLHFWDNIVQTSPGNSTQHVLHETLLYSGHNEGRCGNVSYGRTLFIKR